MIKKLLFGSALILISLSPLEASAQAPADWSKSYFDVKDNDGNLKNGEASPYVKSLISQLTTDLYGLPAKPYHGYFSRAYRYYSTRYKDSSLGPVYWRHTGLDVDKPKGSPVYALTNGVVVKILGNKNDPANLAMIIKEDGANRYWVYGHVIPAFRVGQRVDQGVRIGEIVNQDGIYTHTHVHITVFTTAFPLPSSNPDSKYVGWGVVRGKASGAEAEARAKKYTIPALEAYALSRGLPH